MNKEAYIDASNVMLLYKGKGNQSRLQDGWRQEVRVAKATGEVID